MWCMFKKRHFILWNIVQLIRTDDSDLFGDCTMEVLISGEGILSRTVSGSKVIP